MKKIVFFLWSFFCISLLFGEEPVVQDLKAVAGSGTRIVLTWKNPTETDAKINRLRIYRLTKPVSSYNQIKNTSPIAEVSPRTQRFVDNVQNYNDYFYAVVAVTDKPYDFIFPSMNATVNGAHLEEPEENQNAPAVQKEEKLYESGELRETPLPFIQYFEETDGESLISKRAEEAARNLGVSSAGVKKGRLLPFYFEEDLVSPDGGDDYILFEILKNYFVQEDYQNAIRELSKLTAANISQSVQNRAYFYIGEAQFFTGDYENAVKNFLKVTHEYPAETKPWINTALDKIAIP